MTPSQAYMRISRYILPYEDTGLRTVEEWTDFALQHVSEGVRRLAFSFIEEHMTASPDQLQEMWLRSNARFYPSEDTALDFTARVLARLKDESIPNGEDIPEVGPGP